MGQSSRTKALAMLSKVHIFHRNDVVRVRKTGMECAVANVMISNGALLLQLQGEREPIYAHLVDSEITKPI